MDYHGSATPEQTDPGPERAAYGPATVHQAQLRSAGDRGRDGHRPPPAKPLLAVLPIDGLSITNTAGVIAIKLHTTGSPPDSTMLRACPPQNSGSRRGVDYRFLGILDSPVNSYVTITAAYTSRFGVPPVGKRVFVSVNANLDGYEGIPQVFSARVPAAV